MGKLGSYQPNKWVKNYSRPTSKPLSSHSFYQEKVWTLHEQIYKKFRTVAKSLETLYPKLTDDTSMNIKVVIEKNLEVLIKDLELMQNEFKANPYTFETKKLKLDQERIAEMKNVCDTLQTVRSYEHEVKKLGKIKHELNELEHLLQAEVTEKAPAKPQKKQPVSKPATKLLTKPKVKPKTKKAAAPKKAAVKVKKAAAPKKAAVKVKKAAVKVKKAAAPKKAAVKVKKAAAPKKAAVKVKKPAAPKKASGKAKRAVKSKKKS